MELLGYRITMFNKEYLIFNPGSGASSSVFLGKLCLSYFIYKMEPTVLHMLVLKKKEVTI